MTPEQKEIIGNAGVEFAWKLKNDNIESSFATVFEGGAKEVIQNPGRYGIGPVWVKASNRLPGLTKEVKWRSDLVEIDPQPTWVQVILDLYGHVKNSLEWLDESGSTPSQDVSVLVAEIERLKSWKIQSSELLNPLLEYGQGRKDIPLGASITAYILMWAKKYHEQSAEIERLNGLIELAYSEGKKDGVDGFEGGWIMFKTENDL